jgi:hypothetical protein
MPESSSICLLNMVANNGYGRLLSWDLERSPGIGACAIVNNVKVETPK